MILNKSNQFIKVMCFLIIIILLIIKPDINSEINVKFINFCSILFFISIFTHFKSITIDNWFRLDVIFILGFIIVHFQWPLMYGTSGLVPDNIYRIWVDEKVINYSTWISTLGAVSWILGFHIKSIKFNSGNIFNSYFFFEYKKLLYFTTFLFILFLIFAGRSFFSGSVYKGEGGSINSEGVSRYIYLLFSSSLITLTTVIFLNEAKNYNNKFFKWILNFDKHYLLLAGSYIFIFLTVGDRGGPLTLIIMILILFSYVIRPIKFREFILIVLVGSLIMTIISLGRNDSSGISILSSGASKFELNSGYDLTLELANSVRTLNTVIAQVDRSFDFGYGQFWIADILSPLPFTQSIVLNFTDLKSYQISSTGYITYLTFGPNPSSGEGTTLIADIYLNFGIFGTVICMLFLGMIFSKLSSEVILGVNVNFIIVAVAIGGLALYYSRSGLLNPLREIIWSLVIYKLFIRKIYFNENFSNHPHS